MTEALAQYNPVELVQSRKVQATECGMVILDPDMTFDEAHDIINELRARGHAIERAEQCVQVCDGDMMLYVENRFPQTWPQMFDAEDWKRRRNHKYVAANVPMERRRTEPQITFEHYRFVAKLSGSEQKFYLQKAVDEGLSARGLRRLIDSDLVDRLLDERTQDNEFWRFYQSKLSLTHNSLCNAIERGKEAAEKELEGDKRGFNEWFRWYSVTPDCSSKSFEENLEDAFNAGRVG